MRRWSTILAAVVGLAAMPAFAAPLDAALQQQLLALFDSYNKAIAAGKLPDALALRSAEVRKQLEAEMKTAKGKSELLAMSKMMAPDSLEVLHATINAAGDKAHIMTLATKTIPKDQKMAGGPPPGSVMHSGLTLDFVKQGGAWKFDIQTFGHDPSKTVACKSYTNEPASAYNENSTTSMGGPIVRVDFQPTYTLIVFRIVDEENCAFLRGGKDELMKHGLDPAKLVPYAIVEIEGSPHKTDKQKFLVDSLKVTPEE
jgi:hypothetical protein